MQLLTSPDAAWFCFSGCAIERSFSFLPFLPILSWGSPVDLHPAKWNKPATGLIDEQEVCQSKLLQPYLIVARAVAAAFRLQMQHILQFTCAFLEFILYNGNAQLIWEYVLALFQRQEGVADAVQRNCSSFCCFCRCCQWLTHKPSTRSQGRKGENILYKGEPCPVVLNVIGVWNKLSQNSGYPQISNFLAPYFLFDEANARFFGILQHKQSYSPLMKGLSPPGVESVEQTNWSSERSFLHVSS